MENYLEEDMEEVHPLLQPPCALMGSMGKPFPSTMFPNDSPTPSRNLQPFLEVMGEEGTICSARQIKGGRAINWRSNKNAKELILSSEAKMTIKKIIAFSLLFAAICALQSSAKAGTPAEFVKTTISENKIAIFSKSYCPSQLLPMLQSDCRLESFSLTYPICCMMLKIMDAPDDGEP
eukprot:Gb_33940 [translate_table: standard]